MSLNRSENRNVHFFSATNLDDCLGGLIQNGSVTKANFIDMLAILILADSPMQIKERASGILLTRTDEVLSKGNYDIYCDHPIRMNDERWQPRIRSHSVSGRDNSFRSRVRARDGKCVISGHVNKGASRGGWSGFEAAHVFPLSGETSWLENGFDSCITDPEAVTGSFASKINSVQNGFILLSHIHSNWDSYLLSVNPDDGYKVIAFDEDNFGMDGRTLDPVCLAGPYAVPDQLLRWHFRQTVFANMRGAGEPIFEEDFPPGSDIIREIMQGPYSEERLEMEFQSRLSFDQHMV